MPRGSNETKLRLVILESPYAAPTPDGVATNIAYARRALRDSLGRDEAPIASHLLYTQPGVLNDKDADQRRVGMNAGHAWLRAVDAVVVYEDWGISSGMRWAIKRAEKLGIPVEYRRIGE